MGRMKEVYTELQNKYGENLEDAPKDFSMENYLKELAEEAESLERWKMQLSTEEFNAKFPYYNK